MPTRAECDPNPSLTEHHVLVPEQRPHLLILDLSAQVKVSWALVRPSRTWWDSGGAIFGPGGDF